MRTLLFLLCTLPFFCIAQSTSNSTTALQHQEALQQLQQQFPKAQTIDLEALKNKQEQMPTNCSSCAKKAAKGQTSSSVTELKLSKDDLLAKQTQLVNTINNLRETTPVDMGLIKKYRTALELNLAALKTAEAEEQRQAKKALKQ